MVTFSAVLFFPFLLIGGLVIAYVRKQRPGKPLFIDRSEPIVR